MVNRWGKNASSITADGNIGHLKVHISAVGVEEFNAALQTATVAAKEFAAALRTIPWFFRVLWYMRDILDRVRALRQMPVTEARERVINRFGFTKEIRVYEPSARRAFYSHAD